MATYFVKSKLSDLKAIVKTQSANFAKLNNTYDNVINIYQNYNEILKNEMTDDKSNQKLLYDTQHINALAKADMLAPDKRSIPLKGDILGIEDDGAVRIRRRLEDNYNNGLALIEAIEKENDNAIKLYNSPFSFVLPQKKDLFENTSSFVNKIKPAFTYFKARTDIELESIFFTISLTDAMQVVADNSGNKTSIDALKKEVSKVDALEERYRKLDISKLPKSLQDDHTGYLQSYAVLKSGLHKFADGYEKKDVNIVIEGSDELRSLRNSDGEISQSRILSAWKNDLYKRDLNNLQKTWNAL